MKTKFIAICLLVLICMSCSMTKETYLTKFEKFIQKIETESPQFTDKDWEKADKTFSTFTGKQYDQFESELTPQESLQVAKLTGKYHALQLKYEFIRLKNKFKKNNDK